jgi:hypothetical protein
MTLPPLQQFQVPDRKRKFNKSSLYTDETIPPPMNYNVKNWDDYTTYVDLAADRQEKARKADEARSYRRKGCRKRSFAI